MWTVVKVIAIVEQFLAEKPSFDRKDYRKIQFCKAFIDNFMLLKTIIIKNKRKRVIKNTTISIPAVKSFLYISRAMEKILYRKIWQIGFITVAPSFLHWALLP